MHPSNRPWITCWKRTDGRVKPRAARWSVSKKDEARSLYSDHYSGPADHDHLAGSRPRIWALPLRKVVQDGHRGVFHRVRPHALGFRESPRQEALLDLDEEGRHRVQHPPPASWRLRPHQGHDASRGRKRDENRERFL